MTRTTAGRCCGRVDMDPHDAASSARATRHCSRDNARYGGAMDVMLRCAGVALAAVAISGCDGRPPDTAPADLSTSTAETYDPLRGLDPSGRIAQVALPADVPNPDRW